MRTACIILAAGLGTRMNSTVPKVLHKVSGITMLQSVINTARNLEADRIIVVAGEHIDSIKRSVESRDVLFVLQEEAKGTGHALLCVRPALKNFNGILLVMNGDTPLITPDTIKKFMKLHCEDKNAVSVLSFIVKNPADYGRIIRDDSMRVLSIIEDKDADQVQKKIDEVNSGIYAINHNALYLLDEIKMNRSKGEYYLTDIVALSSQKRLKTSAYCIGTEEEFMGINTKEDLYRAEKLMKRQMIPGSCTEVQGESD